MSEPEYTAWLAFKATFKIYNTPSALAVFEDVAARKTAMRAAVSIYRALPFHALKALPLLLYGLYAFLSLRIGSANDRMNKPGIAVVSGFGSEQKAIDRALELFPQAHVISIGKSIKNIFFPASIGALPLFLACFPGLFRIARTASKRAPMMPALLAVGALCSYLRLQDMLGRSEDIKGVLTGSNYQPMSLAFMAAAHKFNMKVFYTNHSFTRAGAKYKPPLYADYSILTGKAKLDEFVRKGQTPKPYILKGLGFDSRPMRLDKLKAAGEKQRIGIFLTAKSELEEIRKLFLWCREHLAVAHFSLRPHPVDLVNQDFSPLKGIFPNLEIDNSMPVQDDAARCDLVFCGNSNAALEVVCIGTPAVYAGNLDRYDYDTCGFVRGGVIPDFENVKDSILDKLCAFYKRHDYVDHVRYFNDAYLRDDAHKENVDQQIAETVSRMLKAGENAG